jgi:L-aspartate oxidase
MLSAKTKYVLLDVSHLEADFIKNRFPTIYETCLSWGLDITREPIPVLPAAHYACGGILVNQWAESSIPRMFALGECSCTGVHGANRLASNSLLEAMVFANRAAARVGKIKAMKATQPTRKKETAKIGPNLMFQVKEIMDENVGLIRSVKKLHEARKAVDGFYKLFEEGIHIINAESRNTTVVAKLVIENAIHRKESRGLHYMLDYPKKRRNYRTYTITRIKKQEKSTKKPLSTNRKKDGTRRN